MKEIEAFSAFKAKNLGTGANNNPCYSSLPWAKPRGEAGSQYDPKKFENYPYATTREDTSGRGNDDGKENYYLRTNLRFTELYSRQNANQIFGIISQSPKYNTAKYLLALEAAGCLTSEDERGINSLLPNLNFKVSSSSYKGAGNDPKIASPLLYAFAKSVGVKDSDWSLEFKAKNASYVAAIPRTGSDSGNFSQDTAMAEVASALVVKDLEAESAQLKSIMSDGYSRGAAEGFGEQWSCIDDLGGAIRESYQGNKKPVCEQLRSMFKAKFGSDPSSICFKGVDPSPEASDLDGEVTNVVNSLNKSDAKKGSAIVDNRCVWCHLTEADQAKYKKGEAIPQEKLDAIKRKIARSDLLEDNLTSGIMPQDDPPLSKADLDSVLLYMKSLK